MVTAGAGIYELSGQSYEYSVSSFDSEENRGIYRYEELTDRGRAVFRTALNETSTYRVAHENVSTAPAFSSDGGRYLVRYEGNLYCVDVDGEDETSVSAEILWRCDRIDVSDTVVHRYTNLSDGAKTAVSKAVAAPDSEVRLDGESPPEFEDGTDAPRLNRGIYYVRYQGDYYRLSVVRQGGGMGAIVALPLVLLGAMGGLGLAVLGSIALFDRRIRQPIAILVGLGIGVGPVVVFGTDVFDHSMFDFVRQSRLLPSEPMVLFLASILAAVVVWKALESQDIR